MKIKKPCLLLRGLILLPLAVLLLWASKEETSGKVTDVLDGDTIVVEGIGVIRLADVDCLEGAEGIPAAVFTRNTLLGQVVTLDLDGEKDRWGRHIGVVYLEGVNFNKLLVSRGYAVVLDFPNKFDPEEWR